MSVTRERAFVADRLAPFGTTIFTEMTRLANEAGAVNLSQGFPDFDGPTLAIEAAESAMRTGRNQYARSAGEPALVEAIAAFWAREAGRSVDPMSEVTVTTGCTEALIATSLGLLNPGDEVILFEPYYDSYRACCAMAGATPKFVTLRPPEGEGVVDAGFTFDIEELRARITPRTRAIFVNTPHNPTGKVFYRAELEAIADLCKEHDLIAITDEVYERLVYEPDRAPHIRLATLPAMWERTITLSSLGKTFSFTGWKVGWAIAPSDLTAAVRAAHQYLTFATATPLQHAAAACLREGDASVAELTQAYRSKRDRLAAALADLGFRVFKPAGSYYILADHTAFGMESDVAFCKWLIEEAKVAAIPPSAFYANPQHGRALVRFAFCKKDDTLDTAIERLSRLRSV